MEDFGWDRMGETWHLCRQAGNLHASLGLGSLGRTSAFLPPSNMEKQTSRRHSMEKEQPFSKPSSWGQPNMS